MTTMLETQEQETGEVTGTPDKDYNLVWFLQQCLSNVLRLEIYAKDAERTGDSVRFRAGQRLGVPAGRPVPEAPLEFVEIAA